MHENIPHVLVFLLLTYLLLIVSSVFGVFFRHQYCQNRYVKEKLRTQKLFQIARTSENPKQDIKDYATDISAKKRRLLRRCLNQPIYYLNSIGFFVCGLGLAFSLPERTDWIRYVLILPASYVLITQLPSTHQYLTNLPTVYALPFEVGASLTGGLFYTGMSLVGGYVVRW